MPPSCHSRAGPRSLGETQGGQGVTSLPAAPPWARRHRNDPHWPHPSDRARGRAAGAGGERDPAATRVHRTSIRFAYARCEARRSRTTDQTPEKASSRDRPTAGRRRGAARELAEVLVPVQLRPALLSIAVRTAAPEARSEAPKYETQSLIHISYAFFC